MKRKNIEQYDAGYSREAFWKKCAAGALSAAVLGSLTACGTYDGNMTVVDYDGAQVCVSESDCSDALTENAVVSQADES